MSKLHDALVLGYGYGSHSPNIANAGTDEYKASKRILLSHARAYRLVGLPCFLKYPIYGLVMLTEFCDSASFTVLHFRISLSNAFWAVS